MLQNSVYIINILSCTATINSHPDSVIRHFIRIFRKCNWLSLFNVDTDNIKDYNKPITTNNEVRKWPISIIMEI